jgi:hypothetical protein
MGEGGSGGKATAVSVRKSEVKNRGPKTEGQKQRAKNRGVRTDGQKQRVKKQRGKICCLTNCPLNCD